ncbi:MAG: sugar transferase [Chloroflexota bacterium]
MSYRTHKHEVLPWVPHKAIFSILDYINIFKGYRTPFSERRVVLFVIDSLLLALAIWGAFVFWGQADTGFLRAFPERMQSDWYWFPALLGGWWILASLNDLYDIPSSYDVAQCLTRLAIVDTLALIIYLLVYFVAPIDALPRIFFLQFLIFSSILIALWRITYIRLSKVLPIPHRILIVGNGEQAQTIAHALSLAPSLRYEIVGYLRESIPSSMEHDKESETVCEPLVGKVKDLEKFTQSPHIHEVIVALDSTPDKETVDLLIDCQANGIRVTWMANLYEKLMRRIPIQHIDPTWALQATVGQLSMNRFQLGMKRLIDIVFTLFAAPLFLIILPLIALAIWLDSGGPIFYLQKRSGRAGKPFYICKFRTMTVNAEKAGKPQWASANDSRITRVGRILRPSRLDELPQIFNILRGDMSIVGPRPERPEFVEILQERIPYYRTRLIFKPGLTGWAQVHYPYGNTEKDAEIKLQYDVYYVRYWSIWLDLYTIFRTIGVVAKLEGI